MGKQPGQAPWSVGLMTGTVLDGNIDVALLRTDGHEVFEFGPWALVPYEEAVVETLKAAVAAARLWRFDGPDPQEFALAEQALTAAQANAVKRVLDDNGIRTSDVGVIGFHGQTVLHRAPVPGRQGQTRQLGDGLMMANELGIDVVTDLRVNDMAHGGQGAPLSAIYHRALLQHVRATPGTVFLNLGGVANLTFVSEDQLIAFDTGPANAPINDWVHRFTGEAMDRDGRLANRGTVDEDRLASMLEHPWLAAPWPKSLDRFDFPADMASGLGVEDGAATLTAFCAGAVARGLALLPAPTTSLIVAGGGRRNPVLMKELTRRTGVAVHDADSLGLRGDAIEAECFAYLAERSRGGLPVSFPHTTGAPRPLEGGVLFAGKSC